MRDPVPPKHKVHGHLHELTESLLSVSLQQKCFVQMQDETSEEDKMNILVQEQTVFIHNTQNTIQV